MTDDKTQPEQLPKALIDSLKSADEPVPLITARVDREVSRMAREQFAERRVAWRRHRSWVAAAASVLVVLFLVQFRGLFIHEALPLEGDIDGSGRVDIADVLALARTAEANGVSQAEIDALALQVVSVSARGESS